MNTNTEWTAFLKAAQAERIAYALTCDTPVGDRPDRPLEPGPRPARLGGAARNRARAGKLAGRHAAAAAADLRAAALAAVGA